MRVTGAYRIRAVLGAFLAVYAVVLARPVLLVGAVGVGVWLLARQYVYVRNVGRVASALDVTLSPARSRAKTDEALPVTLTVDADLPMPLEAEVTGTVPVAASFETDDDHTVRLSPGRGAGTTTYTVSCPVAGRHEFDRPQVTLTDADGLFATELRVGEGAELLTDPRTPRDITVGRSDKERITTYGEHSADRHGSGLDLDEIREYVVGDAVSRIDWNATARFQEAHVKSFEATSNLQTALVVDHRASMGEGVTGQTKFDYARQVALAYLDDTRGDQHALGLYAVGEEGLSIARAPVEGSGHLANLRVQLFDLVPESEEGESDRGTAMSRAVASRAGARIADDESAFGTALRPFLEGRSQYVERVDRDPLFTTVRTLQTRLSESVVTVLVTDDTERNELRDAVRYARRNRGHVVVFLAPTVLFERGGLTDLAAAYDRYRQFESFRRSLSRLDRVSVYELAPGDRLEALLSDRDTTRRASA